MRRPFDRLRTGKGARLGQHFLTGPVPAQQLARAAGIIPGETVIEIGPGRGALTRELLATGARVIAIEKDPALVQTLNDGFAKSIIKKQLKIIEADVRDVSLEEIGLRAGEYTLAANIPYYITGEIIRKFLTTKIQPRAMVLLVQKEVAQRIVNGEPRSTASWQRDRQKTVNRKSKESILSLSVKAYGTPKIIAKVSRGNFSPPPSVDSAILLVQNISRDFFENVDEKRFFDLIHAGFSSKRKLLLGNLAKQYGRTKPILLNIFKECSIPEKARAEDVPLQKWKCLAQGLGAVTYVMEG